MKNSISLLATMALVALSSPLTTNAATQVYDLKTDWSDTQNPNGTWSYRGYAGDLLSNDPIPWGQVVGIEGTFEGITRTTEESVVSGFLEPGDIFVNTSLGMTVRWTAPANGTINITATAWSMEPIPVEGDLPILGASYDWTLSQNQTFLKGGLAAGTRDVPYDFSSGYLGSSTLQNIPVQAGDQINLAFIPFQWSSGDAGKMGLNFAITLTSDAVGPITAIENLAATVFEMNLQNGIENSLDSKLDAAVNALVDANFNNDGAACNSLAAFISAVEAQRGKQITNAQADQLIASAQEIQALLNCGD